MGLEVDRLRVVWMCMKIKNRKICGDRNWWIRLASRGIKSMREI